MIKIHNADEGASSLLTLSLHVSEKEEEKKTSTPSLVSGEK
jgi:hypothetical protein